MDILERRVTGILESYKNICKLRHSNIQSTVRLSSSVIYHLMIDGSYCEVSIGSVIALLQAKWYGTAMEISEFDFAVMC